MCREMSLEPDISLFLFPVLSVDPHFHVEVTKSREIQLECNSGGLFLQPKVWWMYLQGGKIPAVSESQIQNKSALFHVTSSLLFREPSQKNLICSFYLEPSTESEKGRTIVHSRSVFSFPSLCPPKWAFMLTLHKAVAPLTWVWRMFSHVRFRLCILGRSISEIILYSS